MNNSWSKDPRLSGMSPDKIDFLQKFSSKLAASSKENIASTYLSMNMAAKNNNIHFTEKETGTLLAIFSEGMTPEEVSRMEALKLLIKKLAVHSH